ncbi:MAG TPA: hypothetical protein VLW88_08955 [Hyphomicrobium sp.]|nr:hypothetical protein [Hyphomicrobium sp.]
MSATRAPNRLWLSKSAALLILCTAGSAFAQPKTNKDYCDADDGANLVFAIDTTTPYDEKDKDLLVRAVAEIFETMHGGDRIVIRTINESFATSERLIDRCVPRCKAKNIWDDFWKCNQGLIVNDTKKVKQEVVQSLKARLANFQEQPRSDIIRTLSTLSREEMQRGRRRVLYVISDLIENSDYIPGKVFFTLDTRKLMQNVKKYGLLSSLADVDVHVFGVGRDGTPARAPLTVPALKKIMDFWNAYFKASQARSIEISPDIVAHR